ncbi:MAG: FtsW/RodA/SpoVE family cell cycle protein, partial [Flavisolibacter sp.]
MQNNWQDHQSRSRERLWLLVIICVLAVLFYNLYTVLDKKYFAEVPQRLEEGTMINLNDDQPGQRMENLLQKGFYFEDPRDIRLIGSVIAQRRTTGGEVMDNIGELNKQLYNITAEQAEAEGGESFRKRVAVSKGLLGFSGDDSLRYEQEKSAPPPLAATNNLSLGDHTIGGKVQNREGKAVKAVL